MDDPRHAPILLSGLDVRFTERSTRFLFQWLFGQEWGFFTLVATQFEGDIELGHAVYGALWPYMTIDRLEGSGVLWLADPEIHGALRSRLVDLDRAAGPRVLPFRRDSAPRPCVAH